ncbi:unnamed protein product [Brachionus calyciflorus]|uniref:Dynein axonemal intermediate chain 4 n=1 Tax=Brachionus calyciflorus TaxID=104777 RepID=A0A813WNK4_9BILA|nr:unnamed protein product [Brachionus calyciflorus]
MQKSTTNTLRSQTGLLNTNNRTLRQHNRTANSNRTGGLSSSGQNSSAHKVSDKQKPKIFDENNIDVTPKPLFEADAGSKIRHGSALFHSIEGTSTPTDVLSNGSILNNTNAILTTAQSFGAFQENSTHVSSESNQIVPNDSEHDSGNNEKELSALFYTSTEPKKKTDAKTETISLSETQTFTLFDFKATCISNEDPHFENIKQRNQQYLELCKSKSGNDSYADRGINTFNDLPKIKSTQTEKLVISEKGVLCTAWDMYDSYNPDEATNPNSVDKALDDKSDNLPSKDKFQKNDTVTTNVSIISSDTNQRSTVSLADSALAEKNKSNFQEDKIFKSNLFFMERLINLNTYQNKQARYRMMKPARLSGVPSKEDNKVQLYDGPSLEKLWTYSCGLTRDRNVSCMVWNKKNKDIMAAGYGKFEFNDDPSGLVCCWSLKNPEFPERFFKTESGVTSLAFSQKNSNLLAVGLFNGNILVFDVRNNNTIPLISTNDSEHKHLSPVWNLTWTDKDRNSSSGDPDEMEVIMSISSDGRVTQWMIRKGFESSDYLKLKRVLNKGSGSKKDKEKSEGLISRNSGGLCFDIWDNDKAIYLCGTEEGFIHRCSTSYNEQYLDTYLGHMGPIYKLAWSPFSKNTFLSGSADWTIRLWMINRLSPCLVFNSSSKSVFDICWSTKSATLFCCVNENFIELWDLSKSTLDPIYSTQPLGTAKLTSISYSPNSDCLVVGSSDGSLYIYAIKNLPPPTTEKDLEDIITQSLISQLENVKIDEEDSKELMEKHQLELMQEKKSKGDVNDDDDQKDKMDAFEAKLDKIKSENEAILLGKKSKSKKSKSDGKNEESSSEDEKK